MCLKKQINNNNKEPNFSSTPTNVQKWPILMKTLVKIGDYEEESSDKYEKGVFFVV